MQNPDRDGRLDGFLEWLDSDRERAARKYEEIRKSLIQIFTWKNCADAELLADETLNRVISRVPEIRGICVGSPGSYIQGVAKKVYIDHTREETAESIPENQNSSVNENEGMDDCLERCFSVLTSSSRSLIEKYYSQEPAKKPSFFTELSEMLGISQKTLRTRIYRIRSTLEACIQACMEQEGTT